MSVHEIELILSVERRMVKIGFSHHYIQLGPWRYRLLWRKNGAKWHTEGGLDTVCRNALAWADCRDSGELEETKFATRGWPEDEGAT